jgi:acetoin utilization deacetylase AcuC-like enzyme
VVFPALDAFRPELIIVAAGFDACAFDPLGRMTLHSESFRIMTRRLLEVARRLCDGHVVAAHEGGYSPWYVPFCALAFVEELVGRRTEVQDPFLALVNSPENDTLLPHQDAAIAAAETARTGIS